MYAPCWGAISCSADEVPGAAPVAIISYRFWESRFGKRADIVGSIVHVNDAPATIIGVMPDGFVLVYEQSMWMPLVHGPELKGSVFGRLRDDATAERAPARSSKRSTSASKQPIRQPTAACSFRS